MDPNNIYSPIVESDSYILADRGKVNWILFYNSIFSSSRITPDIQIKINTGDILFNVPEFIESILNFKAAQIF